MQRKGDGTYHMDESGCQTIATRPDSQRRLAVRGPDQEQPQCHPRARGVPTEDRLGASCWRKFAGQGRGMTGQPRGIRGQPAGSLGASAGPCCNPRLAGVRVGGQPWHRGRVRVANRIGVMRSRPCPRGRELQTGAAPTPRPDDEGFAWWGGGVRSRCCEWWRVRCPRGC